MSDEDGETPAEEEAPAEEFNWDDYAEGGLATYTSKEYKDFESMYDATLPDETQTGVIDGTIINLGKIKKHNDKESFNSAFNKLWIHGLLHLFGYDDEHFGIEDASISSGTLPL